MCIFHAEMSYAHCSNRYCEVRGLGMYIVKQTHECHHASFANSLHRIATLKSISDYNGCTPMNGIWYGMTQLVHGSMPFACRGLRCCLVTSVYVCRPQ